VRDLEREAERGLVLVGTRRVRAQDAHEHVDARGEADPNP
jgi:hypothetical protein